MESKGSVSSPEDEPISEWRLSSGPHYSSFTNSLSSLAPEEVEKQALSQKRAYITVALLCYINLVNYMDRYIVAGIIPNIQQYFAVDDSNAALLQTGLMVTFMLTAPLFGYLGDRYNRKYIIIGGSVIWIVTSFSSSFVSQSQFWLLILMRAMVGIGEASYCTIAPTIIGDLFVGNQRSTMICFLYIPVPVGSGLGVIVGSQIINLTGDWHWALRITPVLGLVGAILVFFCVLIPPRGAAETSERAVFKSSAYLEDVKYLLKNKSYVWSTLGITALTFNAGALLFWIPALLIRARVFQGLQLPCTQESCPNNDSFVFGIVSMVTGLLGACLGSILSRLFRNKVPYVDPLICAVGLLTSAPLTIIGLFVVMTSIPATYVLIFFGETFLGLNWAVMADILLNVVIPTRRATAEAFQITLIHLLGDSWSPYLIGLISDAVQKSHADSQSWHFHSLQYSMLLCPAVEILGGLFYILCLLHIKEDMKAVSQYVNDDPSAQLGPAPEPSDQPPSLRET